MTIISVKIKTAKNMIEKNNNNEKKLPKRSRELKEKILHQEGNEDVEYGEE